MNRPFTPRGVRPPFARYSHAVEVPPNSRLVFVSGQLGVTLSDHIPETAADQAALIFEAIRLILADAGMDLGDVVRLNAFVTDAAYLKDYMSVRDRYMPTPPPASTLMIVSGFARPEFKIEIEAVAAREALAGENRARGDDGGR